MESIPCGRGGGLTCLFATSLAPMPKASVKAIAHAATNPGNVSSPIGIFSGVRGERRGLRIKVVKH